MKIPFSPPDITEEEIEQVSEALRSGWIGIEVLNHYTEEHKSSGHLYITRVPGIALEQRHEIIVKMAEAGVACNVHYKPLPMMTAYTANCYLCVYANIKRISDITLNDSWGTELSSDEWNKGIELLNV